MGQRAGAEIGQKTDSQHAHLSHVRNHGGIQGVSELMCVYSNICHHLQETRKYEKS